MKKLTIISFFALAAVVIISCDDVQRKPGLQYMPDMGLSRAYETYAGHDNLASLGIGYNNLPVSGTISRGQELPYPLKNDSAGYAQSASVVNPIVKMSLIETTEAERLYLVNCAICHGTKLDGNGPLYKDGNGPYPAKPATLVGDPAIEAKSEGMYFHVQTYGKGQMGSYASQLNKTQRWMISRYIKMKQGVASETAEAPAEDSAQVTAK